MIKQYFFWICLVFGFNATAQVINFPDANFKNLLLTELLVDTNADGINDSDVDTNNDGEINQLEALQVTWLTINGSNITNLSGIEYFTQITDLYISGIQATSVNLSSFSLLWRMWCNNTFITEINLCGTNVRHLWCQDNPYLTSLYLKNEVISNDLAKNGSQIPPPLHNFEFGNTPLLNYICYDEGEYPAVLYGIGFNTSGKTLTTDCNNTCALSVADNESIDFGVYPNPTNNILHLVLSPETIVKSGCIYNIMGQKVVTFDTVATDVSFLPQGHYLIALETDKGKATKPFVKL